jgi:dephospho-CoA kinase
MLNVGLTGNIASGKSTVARWFAHWGATVIDADAMARDAERPGTPTLEAIVQRFGAGVLRPDGFLDRALLRDTVMRDADARAALNAIVHPAVREARGELAARAAQRGDLILVNDIPLLFEALDPSLFDLIVLVDAPAPVRRDRIMAQRGLSCDEADQMIAAQIPPGEKRSRSHIVIDNRGTLRQLEAAAGGAWRTIRQRAAAAEGASGPLLAVAASPAAAARDLAGTCARYADAGVAVHLASVAARADDLAPAQQTLDLAGVVALPFTSGTLEQDTAAGPRELAVLINRVAPRVIITSGGTEPRGAAALGEWVQRARREAGADAALFHAADPADHAVAARLDVRPWRDAKRAAMAAFGAAPASLEPEEHPRRPSLEREWFAAERVPERVASGLFVGGMTPG